MDFDDIKWESQAHDEDEDIAQAKQEERERNEYWNEISNTNSH